jgi:predicted  nucleic acid-binding Zn-ribbon protein
MTAILSEFATLEERVRAVTELVDRLRDENRLLASEREELRAKMRALEAAAGKNAAADWKPRVKALEEERAALLDERRALARRLEEMLAKLAVLEKAVHA